MIRKIGFILAVLLHLSICIAQEPIFVFEDTINDDNFIRITAFDYYSSNRLNNDFMDKFLFGGQITNEIKDKNASRLKFVNAIGGEFEHSISSYSPDVNLFKREDWGMKLTFSDNHYASAHFTKDLFNTAFYGNANYVGDTMDYTFSSVQYQHYQKLGVGFYHQYNLSSITVNFVTGSRTFKGSLNDSYMHTHNDVDSIDFYLNGEAFMTDRFFPYWAFQGTGFSVDIDYNFIFQGKVKNRQVINFKMSNLGMIFWNKKTHNYIMTTDATYSGIDIQDLLNKDTTIDNSINWRDTLNIGERIGSQVDILPIELVVQKLPDQAIDSKWQAIFGFKAIMVPNYFPYLFAGAYYKPTDNIGMSSRVSYGGFAGFRWGYNFNYWVKDKLYFSAGTFDIIGLASKKYGFGRSVNFSMYFKL
ncbi:MAG: DUF5723 family protein [Crocinitomicaceae bacterium]